MVSDFFAKLGQLHFILWIPSITCIRVQLFQLLKVSEWDCALQTYYCPHENLLGWLRSLQPDKLFSIINGLIATSVFRFFFFFKENLFKYISALHGHHELNKPQISLLLKPLFWNIYFMWSGLLCIRFLPCWFCNGSRKSALTYLWPNSAGPQF